MFDVEATVTETGPTLPTGR